MTDDVFRALADPTRRHLLDRLSERGGQTLTELERDLSMTRFGVMKHLRVLEGANLVVARRAGRAKRHYLNPVPIRQMHDRWMSKFTERWTDALREMQATLEGEPMPDESRHVFQIYIRATPEQVWDAITQAEFTKRYFHATHVDSEWSVGSPVRYLYADGRVAVEGEVLEVDRPHRLIYSWHVLYHDEAAAEAPSRVTWELAPSGETTKLTMVHDRFPEGSVVYPEISTGWAGIISSMKSLIETNEPLAYAS